MSDDSMSDDSMTDEGRGRETPSAAALSVRGASVRAAAAALLCWVPLLAIAGMTAAFWPVVWGEIATQWSGSEVATRAPGWTAVLLPATGALLCAVIATAGAASPDRRERARTFLASGGVAAVLAVLVAAVLIPNVVQAASPSPPTAALLAPLAFAYGLLPWAVAPRPERTAHPSDTTNAEE